MQHADTGDRVHAIYQILSIFAANESRIRSLQAILWFSDVGSTKTQ